MYVYTITIGRNVGDVPMPDEQWHAFQQDVNSIIGNVADPGGFFERHTGIGVWSLAPEQSHKQAFGQDEPLTDLDLHNVRVNLAELARRYQQDAIALTIGQSELIS